MVEGGKKEGRRREGGREEGGMEERSHHSYQGTEAQRD